MSSLTVEYGSSSIVDCETIEAYVDELRTALGFTKVAIKMSRCSIDQLNINISTNRMISNISGIVR